MEALQRFRFVGIKAFTSRRLFPMKRWYPNYYTYLVDHSPFPWNVGFYWCFGPPKHISKSVCELCFSRLLLPESHARCILIQIGTPVLCELYTRSIRGQHERFVHEMACHELLKQDCYTGAGTTDSFSVGPTCIEQAHLSPPSVLALFSIHFAFMFFVLVFMCFQITCTSFHFDDPRSSIFIPMSVKRRLNAEGTAFTWMLSTGEQFCFIPPWPTSTSACI